MSVSGVAILLVSFFPYAFGHGAVSRPSGRVFPQNRNCPWCMGEHKPGSNPYGTVNRNERLSSPCMGSSRGASTRSNWGPYAGVAGEFDRPTYKAGETFNANVVLDADHGGDAQWQICPHSEAETEDCFLRRRITEWEDVHCPFGRCDAGPHKFDGRSFTDHVTIPGNIPSGGATLRWLWVCKWTDEVFTTCIDVNIVGSTTDGDSDNTGSDNTGGTCSAVGDDCRQSKCCSDAGKTCYEKNEYWGGCRDSCAAGEIDPSDPVQYQTPWSCKQLSTTTVTTTAGSTGDGASTQCPSVDACKDNQCYTCKARAEWVQKNYGVTQAEADRRIAAEFPGTCAACTGKSTTDKEDNKPTCFDLEKHCAGWAAAGYCEGRYHDILKIFCPASCGHCVGAAAPPLASNPMAVELPDPDLAVDVHGNASDANSDGDDVQGNTSDANSDGDDVQGNTSGANPDGDTLLSGAERIVATWLSLVGSLVLFVLSF